LFLIIKILASNPYTCIFDPAIRTDAPYENSYILIFVLLLDRVQNCLGLTQRCVRVCKAISNNTFIKLFQLLIKNLERFLNPPKDF
jgi:hypothetical protein